MWDDDLQPGGSADEDNEMKSILPTAAARRIASERAWYYDTRAIYND